jgi:hypothetical protein
MLPFSVRYADYRKQRRKLPRLYHDEIRISEKPYWSSMEGFGGHVFQPAQDDPLEGGGKVPGSYSFPDTPGLGPRRKDIG